ncbi:MAG: tetratricopeptide repeat protein, partial [Thermoguttaceae bacterium]|nr:tetratricopeptide repeat protein [Thermoguttaceae bacterium]
MSSGETNRDPLAIRGDRGADQRGWFRRWAIGLVLAAAVLLVAAMVGVRCFTTEEPAANPKPPAASVSLPASRAPPALRPTITLPEAEAEATADALQQETREVANRLRDRWPDSPEALHAAAMVHAMLRETAEAERLWQRSIELDPRGTQYYVNLAAIAIDRGNSELARATLQQALDKGCTSADVYHHLALALTNLGRCEEAAEVARKGLATYPDSAGCWRMLGESQLKLGKAAEAEASLRQAIDRGSSSASAYFALANACARQGKREEAAEFRKLFAELKGAEPIDPQQRYQVLTTAEARRNAVAALWEAATICAWKGDLAEAEKLLLRALAIEPARADFLRALSALYRNQGRYADAEVV